MEIWNGDSSILCSIHNHDVQSPEEKPTPYKFSSRKAGAAFHRDAIADDILNCIILAQLDKSFFLVQI